MRSADYPYPPDEFDAAAGSGGPRGVHRTPRSAWSRWWPFLVVVVLFPALAFGMVTWVSNGGGLPWSGAAAGPSASSTSPSGTTTESSPSESASESPTQTPSPTETPTPEPDLATAVQVENATKTSGLAGGARDTLKAAGFTDVSIGNWTGPSVGTTVVFYPAAADLGTAAKVAELLGIDRVVEDATQAADGVVVVLEADFTP
ncbi:MAG: LytR C-terminal domain-containing protein [Actinomycetales bacterium]|nr:LytR C-terminal domain-containing protein [Actinomycetales bacterium]